MSDHGVSETDELFLADPGEMRKGDMHLMRQV
jgi:hypothetical protein